MLKTILVPLDGSALAEQALGTAAVLARASGASLDLVSVVEPTSVGVFDEPPWSDKECAARQKYFESIAAELASGASVSATVTVLKGRAADTLCERARSGHADLVVLSSHGRSGFNRAWLGSVAAAMIRQCDAPVLVLRPEPHPLHPSLVDRTFSHVLVPLDGSALSFDILGSATDLAKISGARITALRIVAPMPLMSTFEPNMPYAYSAIIPDEAATKELVEVARTELGELAARLHDETGVTMETTVVVDDHTARAIAEYAQAHDVDLIAMSTHGRGASRLIFGSVADKVLRSSGLPVLMHRPLATSETEPILDEESVCAELPALGTT
jgi:nucleotide-binding universal stress UspA family protein